MVADIEELENLDASEIHARRLSAKEVFMPKSGEHFTFPIADGPVKSSGREQVFRRSTSIQDHPARGEEHNGVPRGESDGSQPSDTLTDDGEARNDVRTTAGNYSYRRHVEPRVKLHVPKEGFPIPLQYFDVVRRTNTTLDVLLESRVDDYLNVDGDQAGTKKKVHFA